MTTPNAARTVIRSAPVRQSAGDTLVEPQEASAASGQPRLNATTRSGLDDGVRATPNRSPISRHHLNTLQTLRGLLDELIDSESLVHSDVVHFFASMKTAEKTGALPELIRQHRNAPELSRLTNALTLFLGQLNQALNPREKSSAVNAAAWSVEELRTIFLGLATCANPLCGLIFTNDQLKEVHPPLQGITDSLMRLAIAKNLRETADSASVWLDIMNWLSRAMKSGLITASANIKAFAPRICAGAPGVVGAKR